MTNPIKVRLTGADDELLKGAAAVAEQLDVELTGDGGIEIMVVHAEGPLEASLADGAGVIRYDRKIHFFRAFGLWVQSYRSRSGQSFRQIEQPKFDSNGVMIDASRGAVPTVESIRRTLRMMAVMGLNTLMLYTEDTFAIEEYPYFGYMRGRYTQEELKLCDDYADQFGIEIIPCIQTLAHLTEALKWNYAGGIRDTEDILLVGSEETYTFIERMIRAASAPFRSRKIHIGMDEAHRLGLGKYLERHGYRQRFDIMNEHLQRVVGIAESMGLAPMIWSDMYFRLGSKTGGYYDLEAEIPDQVISGMPQKLQFVYWDYYHEDPSFYRAFIRKHKAFGSTPVFAGGIWTWNGIVPNYGKTWVTTNAALGACKTEGVREVFATMWGDNGAETSFFSGLAGLQLFAEHGYADEVDQAALGERFGFCTGGRIEDFLALSGFDETLGIAPGNPYESNPSKFLLWQDVLIGLYDDNVKGLPMSGHYSQLANTMKQAAERNGDWNRLFEFYEQLACVLSGKSELGIRLKAAYDQGDKDTLLQINGELENLLEGASDLRKLHRSNWHTENKPFGWEAIDIRYGGVLARLDTARQRIGDYAAGVIPALEELEAERLYYDAPWVMSKGTLGRGRYDRIVTAGVFSG